MIERAKRRVAAAGGQYFARPVAEVNFIPTGSKLLDLALGGGWAQNRIANVVGDKCLSGDTIVSARRGNKPRKMTLRTLFARVHGNHWNRNDDAETFLLADIGGYAGMARMVDIIQTGVKTLYEITDEHDNSIKASEDHQFAIDDGWQRLSDGLGIGSLVKRWRGTRTAREPYRTIKKREYTYSIPFHPFGQQNLVAGRNYKRLLTARLIIEAAINGLSLGEFICILRNDPDMAASLQYTSPNLDVHHLNGDCTDDRLENLELIDPEDHWDIHADAMPTNVKAIELTRIKSVVNVGQEPTFDITMEAPHHNFIANGFVVHNSTGKTLLMIEACANFIRLYPDGGILYRETEAAFQKGYAQALGMPVERIDFGNKLDTVEDLFEDLQESIKKSKRQSLYIVDSLDALSDRDELDRDIDQGSYGAAKAKKLSELFRRLGREFDNMTILIVSQVRDKIGVRFGPKTSRSGGRALDFYAAQVVYLSQIGRISKTISGAKRAIGVNIRAKVDKNKISLPFREAEFPILFGFGIDDMTSCLEWMNSVGILSKVNLKKDGIKDFVRKHMSSTDPSYEENMKYIHQLVQEKWYSIETQFLPVRRKY